MIGQLFELKNIQFINPEYLKLFFVVYFLSTLWIITFAIRYKNRAKRTVGSHHSLMGRMLRFCLVVIVLVLPFSVFSLARPYLSKGAVQFKTGTVEIVFIVDDSSSMWARDISPSRIDIAIREIARLYSQEAIKEGDKAALVLFGKTSLKKLRLSRDLNRFLNEVSKVSQPESLIGDDHYFGSDIPLVLEDTHKFLDRQDNSKQDKNWRPVQRSNRIVLFFGDGDYHLKEYSLEDRRRLNVALLEFRRRGLKIFSVGIGTRRGVPLTTVLANYKKGEDYNDQVEAELREQGITRLDTTTLGLLSSQTGGSVATVENGSGSAEGFLKNAINDNRNSSLEVASEPEKKELWREFLLAAIFFVLIAIKIY
ncbi:MAG: VWA domain-containing protein [bacterium]|nr:VWA domain-containing protein [bacterium]